MASNSANSMSILRMSLGNRQSVSPLSPKFFWHSHVVMAVHLPSGQQCCRTAGCGFCPSCRQCQPEGTGRVRGGRLRAACQSRRRRNHRPRSCSCPRAATASLPLPWVSQRVSAIELQQGKLTKARLVLHTKRVDDAGALRRQVDVSRHAAHPLSSIAHTTHSLHLMRTSVRGRA